MYEIGDEVCTEWHEITVKGVVIEKNQEFYAVRLVNDFIVFRSATELWREE